MQTELILIGIVVVTLAALGVKSGVIATVRQNQLPNRVFWISIAIAIFMGLVPIFL